MLSKICILVEDKMTLVYCFLKKSAFQSRIIHVLSMISLTESNFFSPPGLRVISPSPAHHGSRSDSIWTVHTGPLRIKFRWLQFLLTFGHLMYIYCKKLIVINTYYTYIYYYFILLLYPYYNQRTTHEGIFSFPK